MKRRAMLTSPTFPTISKWIIAAALLLMALSGCATRRDVTTIDSRLSEMELRDAEDRRRRDDFAKNREATEQALRQQSATTRAQIDEIREEMRVLTGRIEELEHSMRQQRPVNETSDKPIEDRLARLEEAGNQNSQRLSRIEQVLKLEPMVAGSKPESRIKPEAPAAKAPSETELYNKAKQAFDQGNMAAARKGFEDLILNFPNSQNADNAQFWIGETFFREKQYEKAILEYQKVIEKYPKGNKVPAALLKQGYAFQSLGDKVNSRLIFEELVRKHPNTSEAKAASDKLKEMR
jgi:tol-pal system protein YbgF